MTLDNDTLLVPRPMSTPSRAWPTFPLSSIARGGVFFGGELIMNEDFFSLGYKIIPRYAFKLPFRLWTLYALLIYLATYKPRFDPRLRIDLEAGEIVTTWGALARRLDRTESQVKTDMRKLRAGSASISYRTAHRSVIVTLRDYRAYQDLSRYSPAEISPNSRRNAASKTKRVQEYKSTGVEEEAASTEANDDDAPLVEKTFRDRIGTVDRWTPADAKRVRALLEDGAEADLLCAAIYLAVGRAYTRACREKKEGEPLKAYFRRCPGQVIGSFAYMETVIAEAKAAQALGSIGKLEGFWEYTQDSVERMEAGENE